MPREMLRMVLIGGAAFTLLICLWLIVLTVWAARKRRRSELLERRLGLANDASVSSRTLRLWHEGRETETAVAGTQRVAMSIRFAALCRDAGWESPPATILLGLSGLMCAAFALTYTLSGSSVAALAAAAVALLAFRIYLSRCLNQRRALFENQLIDALELAGRSLRVGHPLISAFQLISEEIDAPVGALFADIVQQQELGSSLDEAIRNISRANSSDDLKLFATAVVIQLRSGGNLADMMERVASVMRDRTRLARRVRILMAQAQLSKQVLLAMPVAMFVLLNWLRPDYMRPLYTDETGKLILLASGSAMFVGAVILNRLAVIRY